MRSNPMIQQRQIWPRGSNPFPQLLGFALALSAFAAPAHAAENLIVLIDSGEVKGTTEAGAPSIDVFRGIPFAAPPVGDLRWREPQPVKPWPGIRQAAEYGDDCPVANSGGGGNGPFFGSVPADHARFSEDCLLLNVWTPEWPAGGKKPVMIW